MLVIGIGLTNSKNRSKAKKPFKNKALAGYMLVRQIHRITSGLYASNKELVLLTLKAEVRLKNHSKTQL
jgi:hypothetical protein